MLSAARSGRHRCLIPAGKLPTPGGEVSPSPCRLDQQHQDNLIRLGALLAAGRLLRQVLPGRGAQLPAPHIRNAFQVGRKASPMLRKVRMSRDLPPRREACGAEVPHLRVQRIGRQKGGTLPDSAFASTHAGDRRSSRSKSLGKDALHGPQRGTTGGANAVPGVQWRTPRLYWVADGATEPRLGPGVRSLREERLCTARRGTQGAVPRSNPWGERPEVRVGETGVPRCPERRFRVRWLTTCGWRRRFTSGLVPSPDAWMSAWRGKRRYAELSFLVCVIFRAKACTAFWASRSGCCGR